MKTFNRGDAELEKFVSLFLKEKGLKTEFTSTLLASDGSTRVFHRITPVESPVSFVLMENPPVDDFSKRENRSYLMIGSHLFKKGLPVPEIYREDLGKGWFIMEDLGDVSLQQAAHCRGDRVGRYQEVIEILFRLQIEGAEEFDPSWTCQTEKYDKSVMRRYESDYFKEAFLCSYLGLKREWPELESPFAHLAAKASFADARFFLHRDFQSRNIMVLDDGIGILDWQGGRLGPLGYDLASLLIDPYSNLSKDERTLIYGKYLELFSERFPGKVEAFNQSFSYLALQRNLQILGAFSFLSRVRKKEHFERYIVPALDTLRGLLMDLEDEKLSALTELVVVLHDSMPKTHSS
jgi:N-acetylmuramate 1-kinase